MVAIPRPVVRSLCLLPFLYPLRLPVRSYGNAASTSVNSASVIVRIISRTFSRKTSVNESVPIRSSIFLTDGVHSFFIGVSLLGFGPVKGRFFGYQEDTHFQFPQ